VPLIDLHASSKDLCELLGKEKCNELSPVTKTNGVETIDNTHLNAKGSVMFSRLVVIGLAKAVPDLAPCLKVEEAEAGLPKAKGN
jgi:hypothetical protein